MAGNHALLSPSSAHRWHRCNGSVRLSEGLPNPSNIYAAEGTAAHEVAAKCLELGLDPASFIGKTITVKEWDATYQIVFTEGMATLLQSGYIDHVFARQDALDGELLVEQSLPINHITGEFNGKGTSDAVILPANAFTMPVHCGDLKFGRGRVPAYGNWQGALYIGGIIERFKIAHKFVYNKTVFEFAIYQPKLSFTPDTWVIPWGDLDANYLIPLQKSAFTIRETIKDKKIALRYLNPGEKQCEWCPAGRANLCPALQKEVYALPVLSPPVDLIGLAPAEMAGALDSGSLSDVLNKAEMVRNFLDACEARALADGIAGSPPPGYKIVQGDQGNRAWVDKLSELPARVAELLPDTSVCYETKLKSVAQMEKALKKYPDVWHGMIPLIVRPDGKPKLVPDSDPRPALAPALTFGDESSTVSSDSQDSLI